MSKETREKMGEVARTARALLDVITNDDSSPEIDAAASVLSAAISEFEEHLFGTVADVIKQYEAGRSPRDGLFVTDADGIPEPDLPDVVSAPNPDPDDEIPF